MLCLVRTTPSLLPLLSSIELHSSRLIFYRLLLKVKSIFSIRLCKIPKLAFYKVVVRQPAARLIETLFIAPHGGRSGGGGAAKSLAVAPQSLLLLCFWLLSLSYFLFIVLQAQPYWNIRRLASVKSWPPLKLCGKARQQAAVHQSNLGAGSCAGVWWCWRVVGRISQDGYLEKAEQ